METRNRSSAPVTRLCFSLQSSHSPTRHFNSPSTSSSANFAIHRALSPTRVNLNSDSSFSATSAAGATSSSINLAFDRSSSQVRSTGRAISPKGGALMKPIHCAPPKKKCMCSPTNHPGSFRCRLHRNTNKSSSSTQSQLNARRSAMTNSLARIGSVEGEWVKRALTALIRPSSHHTRRRTSFQPRPSRLRHMTMAQMSPENSTGS